MTEGGGGLLLLLLLNESDSINIKQRGGRGGLFVAWRVKERELPAPCTMYDVRCPPYCAAVYIHDGRTIGRRPRSWAWPPAATRWC